MCFHIRASLLLSLKLLFDVLSLGQGPLLSALRKQNVTFLLQMISLPLAMLTYIAFVQWFGLIGSVFSTLFMLLFQNIVREWYINAKLAIHTWDVRSFFSFDEYDRVVLRKLKNGVFRVLKKSSPA